MILKTLQYNFNLFQKYYFSKTTKKPPWNVLFFGADDFSLFSLKNLSSEYRNGTLISKLEVVTTIKGKANPIRIFAEKEKLIVHKWPAEIPDNSYDVGLVVSFGHLIPETVIEKFHFGMLNVHASLLPRWRGAAPIIYAIANGDTKTGITIMRIRPKKFDVGDIIYQASVDIPHNIAMPHLYTELGKLGAKYLIKSLEEMPCNLENATPQPNTGITLAPKVKANFAHIDWQKMSSGQIYNLERALVSVFPLTTTWAGNPVKLIGIQECEYRCSDCADIKPGFVEYDRTKKLLKVFCSDFKYINVEKVGVAGKKVMNAADFNNGYINKEEIHCRYFK